MRLWSVKFQDREVFTHLQGEALSKARDLSTTTPGVWEVITHNINDNLARGELLAACLNRASGWEGVEKWVESSETLATFENGKKVRV